MSESRQCMSADSERAPTVSNGESKALNSCMVFRPNLVKKHGDTDLDTFENWMCEEVYRRIT